MINSAFNRGQKKALTPIKVVGPFPLKLEAKTKSSLYGFGALSQMSAKVTKISPQVLPGASFGPLTSLVNPNLRKPATLGTGSPVSFLGFKRG